MPQKPARIKPVVSRNAMERNLIDAAKEYCDCLKKSVEVPTPERIHQAHEAARKVMLKAAAFMSQETLEKLGQMQASRIMRGEGPK